MHRLKIDEQTLEIGGVLMEQEFTVEQGFAVSLIFFLDLWPLVEPQALLLDGTKPSTHRLFFREACLGYEVSAEWHTHQAKQL